MVLKVPFGDCSSVTAGRGMEDAFACPRWVPGCFFPSPSPGPGVFCFVNRGSFSWESVSWCFFAGSFLWHMH